MLPRIRYFILLLVRDHSWSNLVSVNKGILLADGGVYSFTFAYGSGSDKDTNKEGRICDYQPKNDSSANNKS